MFANFLYANPSALEGVSRLLDLGCTLQSYNSALSGEQADRLAIASDWLSVGDDLLQAMPETAIQNEVLSQAFDELAGAEDLLMRK